MKTELTDLRSLRKSMAFENNNFKIGKFYIIKANITIENEKLKKNNGKQTRIRSRKSGIIKKKQNNKKK